MTAVLTVELPICSALAPSMNLTENTVSSVISLQHWRGKKRRYIDYLAPYCWIIHNKYYPNICAYCLMWQIVFPVKKKFSQFLRYSEFCSKTVPTTVSAESDSRQNRLLPHSTAFQPKDQPTLVVYAHTSLGLPPWCRLSVCPSPTRLAGATTALVHTNNLAYRFWPVSSSSFC